MPSNLKRRLPCPRKVIARSPAAVGMTSVSCRSPADAVPAARAVRKRKPGTSVFMAPS